MRNSLLWKFTLAFMVVAIATAGLVAVFIRITSADRLTNLIVDQQRSNLQTSLTEYYKTYGSWDDIGSSWPYLRSHDFPTPVNGQNIQPPDRGNRDRRSLFGLADMQGVVLIENDQHYPRGSVVPVDVLKKGSAVSVDGKQVGTILPVNFNPGFNPEENLFLQRTTEALIYAVIGAMIFALLIGVFLARTLIHPLQQLTAAAHNIAHGQLEQQVKIGSRDEIGQLGEAFNRMSQEVARVNHLRKQMTADIAHDLRTPLTVIAGYIESMRDGVLQPTPARLTLIYEEIEGLQDLVGDLKMLSQVDAGELPLHPQRIEVVGMLEHAAATYGHRAEQQGVNLVVDAADALPAVLIDEGRMMQVYGNLLSNALRYTPAGGKITLSAHAENGRVILAVEDNGEGIEEDELPFIFDRFHRADKSRHSDFGETGLGLAIVKAVVEAHHGKVRAESKLGEGTKILIDLPAA
jgi:signal transduction histidine kinase